MALARFPVIHLCNVSNSQNTTYQAKTTLPLLLAGSSLSIHTYHTYFGLYSFKCSFRVSVIIKGESHVFDYSSDHFRCQILKALKYRTLSTLCGYIHATESSILRVNVQACVWLWADKNGGLHGKQKTLNLCIKTTPFSKQCTRTTEAVGVTSLFCRHAAWGCRLAGTDR